ncbi:hypothetical protein B0H10DRAFT_2007974 [Mycena sp. CBHHK59/15]|nr:hypothetical protein B0H10DRAFT_2007974 [Mycena sp. CBHHK59/15]
MGALPGILGRWYWGRAGRWVWILMGRLLDVAWVDILLLLLLGISAVRRMLLDGLRWWRGLLLLLLDRIQGWWLGLGLGVGRVRGRRGIGSLDTRCRAEQRRNERTCLGWARRRAATFAGVQIVGAGGELLLLDGQREAGGEIAGIVVLGGILVVVGGQRGGRLLLRVDGGGAGPLVDKACGGDVLGRVVGWGTGAVLKVEVLEAGETEGLLGRGQAVSWGRRHAATAGTVYRRLPPTPSA